MCVLRVTCVQQHASFRCCLSVSLSLSSLGVAVASAGHFVHAHTSMSETCEPFSVLYSPLFFRKLFIYRTTNGRYTHHTQHTWHGYIHRREARDASHFCYSITPHTQQQA